MDLRMLDNTFPFKLGREMGLAPMPYSLSYAAAGLPTSPLFSYPLPQPHIPGGQERQSPQYTMDRLLSARAQATPQAPHTPTSHPPAPSPGGNCSKDDGE